MSCEYSFVFEKKFKETWNMFEFMCQFCFDAIKIDFMLFVKKLRIQIKNI